MQQGLKILFLILLVLLISSWAYSEFEKHSFSFNLGEIIAELNYFYLSLSVLSFFIINFLRTSRFMVFVSSSNNFTFFKLKKSFLIILASFPLAFFFTGSGLVFRSILLKKTLAFPITATFSFFSFDKAIDLFFILGFFIILGLDIGTSYFNFLEGGEDFLYLSLVGLGLIGFGLIFFFYQRDFFIRLLFSLIHLFTKKLFWPRKLFKLNYLLGKSLTISKLSIVLLITILVWIFEYFFIVSLMLSFSPELSFYPSWIIFVLIQLLIIFPIAPSGLGTWEAAFFIAGEILFFDKINFLTLSIFSHLVLVVLFVILLLSSLFSLNLKLSDLKKIIKKKNIEKDYLPE